jgi:hypothetical protein
MAEDISKIKDDPDFLALPTSERISTLVDMGRSDNEIDAIMSGKPMLSSVPNTQLSSKDFPGGGVYDYFKEMAGNAPASAGRLAANIITAPVALTELAPKLGKAAYEVISQPANPASWTTGKQLASGVGQYASERYGSGENILNTIKTDPFGVGADVIGAAEGGAGGLARMGVPGMARAASLVSKADPVRMVAAGAESTLSGLGKWMQGQAIKTYEKASGFEPSGITDPRHAAAEKIKAAQAGLEAGLTISPVPSKISLQERATTGRTGTLTGDLWGNLQQLWGKTPTTVQAQSLRYIEPQIRNKSVHKMAILEAKANEDIAGVISGLEKQGYSLSNAGREELAQQAMDHVLKKISATPDVIAAVKEMRDYEAKVPLSHPDLPPSVTVSSMMSPKQMQARKQTLRAGQGFGKSPLESKLTDTTLSDAFQKAMAHELMAKLEEWAPELKQLNEKSGGRKLMMDALGQYVNRLNKGETLANKAWAVGRLGGAGVGGAAIGGSSGAAVAVLAAFALGKPSVRTSLARALYQASKLSEKASSWAGEIRTTTSSIPEAVTGMQRFGVEPTRETSKSGKPIISNDGGKTWEYE